MAELAFKKQFEREIRALTSDLVIKFEGANNTGWDPHQEHYAINSVFADYVRHSRDIKFRILDQYDRIMTVRDYRHRDSFITCLDKSRLSFRNFLGERLAPIAGIKVNMLQVLE